ncbi:MAG TPA: S8 family serine peptidase, partial [Symbiobacteriaceae bacterium]|nr:S8 family serine peptidase [Symbiobacteriaceae bacterium]
MRIPEFRKGWRALKRLLAVVVTCAMLSQVLVPLAAAAPDMPPPVTDSATSSLDSLIQMLQAAAEPAPDPGAAVEVVQPVGEIAPTQEEPAPVQEEPAPVQEEPAPVQEEPAPVQEEPAPTQEEPAPAEEESTPAPETPPVVVPAGPKVQYIVHYHAGVAPLALAAANPIDTALEGTQLVEVDAANADQVLAALKSDPSVDYVEPNQTLSTASGNNDPLVGQQSALTMERAPQAWTLATGALNGNPATPVTVAVLDTGVDATHEDLAGRVTAGYDVLTESSGPELTDANGHGTAVAGVIAAATNNGVGIAGAAGEFPVYILPIKVLDSTGTGTTYDVARGIEEAVARGAKVINLSLGGRLLDYPITLARAIQSAQGQGVIVVAAAGNEGRTSLEGYYPASLPGVISVQAIDDNGNDLPISNRGATLKARGGNVLTTAPGNQYVTRTGTSFAAPWVAAAAALVYSAHPSATVTDAAKAAATDAVFPSPQACGWGSTGCYWAHSLEASLRAMGSPAGSWIDLTIVEPDAQQPVRVMGTLPISVQVDNPARMTRLEYALYDRAADWDSDPPVAVLGTLQGPAGGGTVQGNFYRIQWDTTTIPNGEYTLLVRAYENSSELNWASLELTVANALPSGLTLQVYKPGGEGRVAAGAPVAIYRRGTAPDGHVQYETVADQLQTDREGRLNVPAIQMADGHDYLVVVQGSEPAFLYAVFVRTPSNLTLNGADMQEVVVSAQRAPGQPVANQVVELEVLDGSFPGSTEPGAVAMRTAAVTLDAGGTATLLLSKGRYNFRLTASDLSLVREDVTVGESPVTVTLSPQAGSSATVRAVPAGGMAPHAYSLKLFGWDALRNDWNEVGVLNGSETFTVSPGKYRAVLTATYRPSATESQSTQYGEEAQAEFTVAAGEQRQLEFGGPLTYHAQRGNPAPVYAGGMLVLYTSLADHEFKVNRLWTAQYRADNSTGPETSVMATVELYDSHGSVVSSNPRASLSMTFINVPQAVPGSTYKVVHKANVGPLSGTDEGTIIAEEITFTVEAAPTGSAPLTVTVKDRSGMAPLMGAGVQVLERVGTGYFPVYESWTDATGVAKFGDLPQSGEYVLAVSGMSMNPADPFSPPEPVFLVVPFTAGPPPMAVTVNLGAQTMERVSLEVRDPSGNVPVLDYGTEWVYGAHARVNGATVGLTLDQISEGSYAVWVPHGNYHFEAYTRTRGGHETLTGPAPSPRYSLITAPVAVPADIPVDGTLVLGGPGQFINLVGPETAPANGQVPGPISLYRTDLAGSGSGSFTLTAGANQAPLYVLPGTYTLVGSVVYNHFDGPWTYFLERTVDLTAPGAELRWQADLNLTMQLELDATLYGAGSTVHTTHTITDSHGNRLVGVYPGLDANSGYRIWYQTGMVPLLTKQGALPLTTMTAQSQIDVAPFLTIKDPNGREIYRTSGGREDWFGSEAAISTYYQGSWVVPEGVASGQYTAVLELGAGPDGMVRAERSFTVSAAPPAPVLTALTSPTNAAEVVVSGSALAGATVTVTYTLNSGSQVTAGTAVAGADQAFSLTVNLPEEGSYVFTATAAKEGNTGPASGSQSLMVDRTRPLGPQGVTGVSPDEKHIRLTWEAAPSADVAGYRIYRAGRPTVAVPVGSELVYQEGDLQPNTEYTYDLTAVDQAGNESDAVRVVAKTIIGVDKEPPAAPAEVAVEFMAEAVAAKLTWSAAEDNVETVGYEIWRKIGEGEAVQVGTTEGLDSTTFTDLLDLAESTYTYTVLAYDLAGNKSDMSAAVQVTTEPAELTAVALTPQRNRNGLIKGGSVIPLTAVGDPRRQVKAEIRLLSWHDDQGNLLTEQAERVMEATLAPVDGTPTRYTGTFTVPAGTERVLSIRFTLSDAASHTAARDASGLPTGVTGNLKVRVSFPDGTDALWSGGRLSVWSESTKGAAQMTLAAGTTEYIMEHLPPASDYRLRVTAPGGRVLAEQTGIRVRGRLTDETSVTPVLPATLLVTVLNGARAAVTIASPDGTVLMHVESTWGSATALRDRTAGEELTVRILPEAAHQAPLTHTLVLQPGENRVALQLTERPRGTVSGQALDDAGAPVSRVRIVGTQVANGKSMTQAALTDNEGRFSLSLLSGFPATLSADLSASLEFVASDPVSVADVPAGDTRQDIRLVRVGTGLVRLSVRSHYIGENVQVTEITDWRTAAHLHPNVSAPRGVENPRYAPYYVRGVPGDIVKACVDGYEAGLGKGCAEAALDQNLQAQMVVDLYEAGRVVGRLVNAETQAPVDYYDYWLSREEQGKWRLIGARRKYDNALKLGLSEPGRYHLALDANGLRAEQVFDVVAGQIVDLHTIAMSRRAIFNGTDTYVQVTPGQAVPGARLTVRAAYRVSTAPLNNATLVLEVPGGTALVEGSIAVNGNQAAATAEGTVYTVALGDLASGASGTLQYQLSVQDQPVIGDMLVRIKLRHGQDLEDLLGSAWVSQPKLTLQAPARTNQLAMNLRGRAPLGSTVRVYAGESLLGEAKAAGEGWWELNATLPDPGKPADFVLKARAETTLGAMTSADVHLTYAPNQPVITKVKMQQKESALVEFDPRQGTARFPYVVVPGQPFRFEVVFDNRDGISEVRVGFSGQDQQLADARYDADKGAFVANVPMFSYDIGKVMVYYKFTGRQQLATALAAIPESEAELRAQLPFGMQDLEFLPPTSLKAAAAMDCSQGNISAETSMRIPKAENSSLTTSLDIACGQTLPTGAKPVKDGVPVWDVKHSYTIQGDEVVIHIEGYIDQSLLNQNPQVVAQMLRDAASGKAPIRTLSGGAVAFVAANAKFGLAAAGVVGKGWANKSAYEKLDELQAMANSCEGSSLGTYQPYIEKLNEKVLAITMTRAVLQAGGFALGVATGGLGAIAVGIVGFAVDQALNYQLNSEMDAWRDHMVANSDCKKKDKPSKNDGDGGGSGGGDGGDGGGDGGDGDGGGGGFGGDGGGGDAGEPTWIWDPSGYVYEAVPTNRLSGVKATVLYWDSQTSTWQVWNATWFAQQNPQTTDPQGKYGWDVPQGRWKVLYEKEGYEPRYSWEMDVPPPHFDVNVGMVSLSAPSVAAATPVTANGAGFIDITFTQYMQVSSLTPGSVTVTPEGEGAQPVAGTLEPVGQVQNPDGVWLTRTMRFSSGANLTPGTTYRITVDQFLQNYAGQALAADAVTTVTMPEQDTQPPLIADRTPAGTLTYKVVTVEATVNDASGVDAASIRLQVDGAPVSHSYNGGKVTSAALPSLSDGAHSVTLTVRDTAGNETVDTWTFEVDTTDPVLTVLLTPSPVTATGTVTVRVLSTEALNSTPVVTLISPQAENTALVVSATSGTEWTATIPVTAAALDGRYTVKATARDSAGHAGEGSAAYTVAIPPALTVTASPTSLSAPGTVTVTVTSGEALRAAPAVQVTAPGGAVQNLEVTADGATQWKATYAVAAGSGFGTYSVKVTGQDANGISAQSTAAFT